MVESETSGAGLGVVCLAQDQEGEAIMELSFANIISPLQLDGPCQLRARLETEQGSLVGRPLLITKVPAPTAH